MTQQVILGMGAGQCGLNLLAEILGKQPAARITLEQAPLLSWESRSDRPGIRERIIRWKTVDASIIGDVASFYLPYVEEAIAIEPGIRIVCLKRPKDEVIAGFCVQLDANRPYPMNHWTKQPPPGWSYDPIWTRTFPQYDTQDRVEGLSRYWEEYYTRAEEFARRFPANVLVIDTDELTSAEGVHAMLDFARIPREGRVLVTGRRPPNPPTLEPGMEGPALARRRDPMDPRRCVILVPFTGFIHQECDSALKELERRGYQVRRVGGFAAIDQGRNQMSTDALMDGFEETMWIDSDVGFHPDEIERLRSHALPITCGVYPQKGKRALACHVVPGTANVTFGKRGGLVEIQYAGTGFLHIRREVYLTIQRALNLPVCNERFQHPMIPFFHPMLRPIEDGYWYLAEDYAFCERARQSGFKIFADTSIRLWHIGTYRYGWEDAGMDRPRFESFTLNVRDAPPQGSDIVSRGTPSARSADAEIAGFAASYTWPAERPALKGPVLGERPHADFDRALDEAVPREARLVVEVGAGLGRTTRYLADLAPRAKIVAIDEWAVAADDTGVQPEPYDAFLSESWDYRERIIPVRAKAIEGLRRVANAGLQPDLIYIDAGAEPNGAREQIAATVELFPTARVVGNAPRRTDVRTALSGLGLTAKRGLQVSENWWRIDRQTP